MSDLVQTIFETARKKGMPIKLLADLAGLDYRSVRRWRKGEQQPSLKSIEAAARVLGLTVVVTKKDAQ